MIVLIKKKSYRYLMSSLAVVAILDLFASKNIKASTNSDTQSGPAIQSNSVRDKNFTTNDQKKPEEQNEEHRQAVAELEKLGGVITLKTSEDGQIYSEVKLLGPRYQREWKGGNQGVKHLSGLANIRSLRIQDVEQFTDEGMIHLKDLKSLRSLMLVRNQVSDDGLAYLKSLTNLDFLGLWSNKQFTDKALDHIKGLTHLKSLRLDDAQITDEGLKKLKEFGLLKPLEFLSLNRTRITDIGLAHLEGMVNIKRLYLSDTRITDIGLVHLAEMKKMEWLTLNNTGVSDAGLVHLKGLTDISGLSLRNTQVTDAGLGYLTGLTKICDLRIGGTRITNDGLVYLKELRNLKSLSLAHTQVTDASLKYLKRLPFLNELFLHESKVSQAGYMALKNSLPDCQIQWAEPRPIKVGGRAPEMSIDRLLQAPEGTIASWESLKGKVVVLEFWATWCGPCVTAISHTNELTEKFKHKPIQFIAITREELSVVEQFLQKRPIRGWIGIDPDGSMGTSFGVTGIPETVVVDKSGIIHAITHPMNLTERMLNKLLDSKDGVSIEQ